jgi:hypothetical protein
VGGGGGGGGSITPELSMLYLSSLKARLYPQKNREFSGQSPRNENHGYFFCIWSIA